TASWLLPLDLTGLTARSGPDGTVGLYDPAGTRVAWFSPGRMEDSRFDPTSGGGARSAPVTLTVTTSGGGPAIRVHAEPAWLHDAARSFPVRVRPVTLTVATGDPAVDGAPAGEDLALGAGGTTPVLPLDDVPATYAGYHARAATLKLNLDWTGSCGKPQ